MKASRYSLRRLESVMLSNSSSVSNWRPRWHLHSDTEEINTKNISRCIRELADSKIMQDQKQMCCFSLKCVIFCVPLGPEDIFDVETCRWLCLALCYLQGNLTMDYLNKAMIHEHTVYIYKRWQCIRKTAGWLQLEIWTVVTSRCLAERNI